MSYEGIELGKKGEDAAAMLLERKGYTIVERNWTCPSGEADIIAVDGDNIVFVEVKTRSGVDKGLPTEAVTAAKRDKYERIAAWYLNDCDAHDMYVRFDVISILVLDGNKALVRHLINAFGSAN